MSQRVSSPRPMTTTPDSNRLRHHSDHLVFFLLVDCVESPTNSECYWSGWPTNQVPCLLWTHCCCVVKTQQTAANKCRWIITITQPARVAEHFPLKIRSVFVSVIPRTTSRGAVGFWHEAWRIRIVTPSGESSSVGSHFNYFPVLQNPFRELTGTNLLL